MSQQQKISVVVDCASGCGWSGTRKVMASNLQYRGLPRRLPGPCPQCLRQGIASAVKVRHIVEHRSAKRPHRRKTSVRREKPSFAVETMCRSLALSQLCGTGVFAPYAGDTHDGGDY